jgi:hypothetical protein
MKGLKTLRGLAAAVHAVALLALTPALALAQAQGASTDAYGRFIGNGPAPTLSSCGTAPTILGTDSAGRITIGTGTPSACTLTFARAWANVPTCYFNDETTAGKTNAGTTYQVVPTKTAVVVTFQAATVNGDVIGYVCVGSQN